MYSLDTRIGISDKDIKKAYADRKIDADTAITQIEFEIEKQKDMIKEYTEQWEKIGGPEAVKNIEEHDAIRTKFIDEYKQARKWIEKQERERTKEHKIFFRGNLKELIVFIDELKQNGKIEHLTDAQIAQHFTAQGNPINVDSLKQIRSRDTGYFG